MHISVESVSDLIPACITAGAFGFTVRTGLAPIIHGPDGSSQLDRPIATHEDIELLMQDLMDSRQMRQFRDSGDARFISITGAQVRWIGGAKREDASIRIEVRRMAS